VARLNLVKESQYAGGCAVRPVPEVPARIYLGANVKRTNSSERLFQRDMLIIGFMSAIRHGTFVLSIINPLY